MPFYHNLAEFLTCKLREGDEDKPDQECLDDNPVCYSNYQGNDYNSARCASKTGPNWIPNMTPQPKGLTDEEVTKHLNKETCFETEVNLGIKKVKQKHCFCDKEDLCNAKPDSNDTLPILPPQIASMIIAAMLVCLTGLFKSI